MKNKRPCVQLHLLCYLKLEEVDLNFIKLIDSMGVQCIDHSLDDSSNILDYLKFNIQNEYSTLLINANLLPFIASDNHLIKYLFSHFPSIFIYNLFPQESVSHAVMQFTDGLIHSISSFNHNQHNYNVGSKSKSICSNFSGVSFGPIKKQHDFKFDILPQSQKYSTLISIDNNPFFMKIEIDQCELFIIANNNIVDIDIEIDGAPNYRNFFSQLIPYMMFIRYICADMCWHTNSYFASFIIDDPILKRKYGFVNYNKLLDMMDKYQFGINIAFIPFNYNKNSAKTIELFRERSDKFSVSIHGCDHTKHEFASTDIILLNEKVRMAKTKMKKLEQNTKLKYDNVMVFPQGSFSTQAIKVIKANNYLAAVNSGPLPMDVTINLKLRAFLGICILNYYNFPLFLRRYPNDIIDFIFDIFLNKPILLVEHHLYLKDGGKALIEFIKKINSIDADIRWSNLEYIAKNSYIQKRDSEGVYQIQVYSNKVTINNNAEIKRKYCIVKKEDNTVPLKKIFINSAEVTHYEIENHSIKILIEIAPKDHVELDFEYDNIFYNENYKHSFKSYAKIYIRRLLCEFRDNYASKVRLLFLLLSNSCKFTRKQKSNDI